MQEWRDFRLEKSLDIQVVLSKTMMAARLAGNRVTTPERRSHKPLKVYSIDNSKDPKERGRLFAVLTKTASRNFIGAAVPLSVELMVEFLGVDECRRQ